MRKYILVLLLLLIPTFSYMARDGIYTMHDPHLFRQYEIDKCAKEWTFPCRWAADSGKGYGVPMFNYYGQTVYWFTEVFHIFGMPLLSSIKVTFSLSLILSAAAMFWVSKSYFDTKGAFIASLFYVYAPYRALDVWVRGAINEAWAFTFYPLIFWSLDQFLLTNKNSFLFVLILSASGLVITHNLSFLMFIPFLGLWTIFRTVQKFSIHKIFDLTSAGLVTFLLSSWYILPVLFESKLTTVSEISQGYYYFKNHYASLKQIFLSNFWGYGGSTWGPNDTISFAVGYLHWIVPLLLIVLLIRQKKISQLLWAIFGLGAVFMTHGKSEFIWSLFKPMEYIQFPWRFLGIAVFFLSLSIGNISKKFMPIVILLLVLINAGKFVPGEWLDIGDAGYFSGKTWENGRAASITDFWPRDSSLPEGFAPDLPKITIGNGSVQKFELGAHRQKTVVDIQSEQAKLVFNTVNFPTWKGFIDGKAVPLHTFTSMKLLGLWVDKGSHVIELKFMDTAPRKIGNVVSVLTLCSLLIWRIKYVNS